MRKRVSVTVVEKFILIMIVVFTVATIVLLQLTAIAVVVIS